MGLLDRIKEKAGDVADSVGGAIDSARETASEAVDTARETASEALDAARETASEAVDTVRDTASAAVDTAQETAQAAETQFREFAGDASALARQVAVEGRQRAADLGAEVRGRLDEIGGDIKDAGGSILEASEEVREAISDRVREGLNWAGETAEGIGREVQELGEGAAREARDLGRRAVETGEQAVRTVEEGIDELGRRGGELLDEGQRLAEEGLDRARQFGEDVVDGGRRLLNMAEEQLDPETHIRKLDSEGDSVRIRLGGSAQVLIEGVPVRGAAQGEAEVQRTANGYTVSVSGQAGIGLYAPIPGTANSQVQANAMLQGGGKVTFSFSAEPRAGETQEQAWARAREEASRAVSIAGRQAAVGAAAASPVPLAGPAAQALIGPSGEDYAFLGDNIHSVELRGGVAGQLAGQIGSGVQGMASGSLQGSAEIGARLNFRDDQTGRPLTNPRVTIFAEGSVQGDGELSGYGLAGRGGFEGKVTYSETYDLDVRPEELMRNPLDAVRVARGTTPMAQLQIEGSIRGGGGVGATDGNLGTIHAGAQAGTRFQVTAQGRVADLQRAQLTALRTGDLERAMGELDRPTTTISGEYGGFVNQDVQIAPQIQDQQTQQGIGMEASYRHHDRGQPWGKFENIPAGELWRRIRDGVGGGEPNPRPVPNPQPNPQPIPGPQPNRPPGPGPQPNRPPTAGPGPLPNQPPEPPSNQAPPVNPPPRRPGRKG